MEQITDQYIQLSHLKNIYEEVGKIIMANKALQVSNLFYGWLRETYSTTMAIGIRRLIYKSRDAICIEKLVIEIKKSPHLLSEDHYLGLHDDILKSSAKKHYKKFFGDVAAPTPQLIQKDLDDLNQKAKNVRCLADKHLAHIDPSPASAVVTFKELHDAYEGIGVFLKKYHNLMKATAWTDFTPMIQENWERIFEIPWVENH